MLKIILLILSLSFLSWPWLVHAESGQGRLVKTSDNSAVYCLAGAKRYAFPDAKTYESWHGTSYSEVGLVAKEELAAYALSGMVTYRPGALIKIQTDPRVYKVMDEKGSIQWVPDEQTAIALYGSTWAKMVRDVPDAFFALYTVVTGLDLNSAPSQKEYFGDGTYDLHAGDRVVFKNGSSAELTQIAIYDNGLSGSDHFTDTTARFNVYDINGKFVLLTDFMSMGSFERMYGISPEGSESLGIKFVSADGAMQEVNGNMVYIGTATVAFKTHYW